MGRIAGCLTAGFLFLAAAAAPAAADDLAALMGAGGDAACFTRTYTGGHLAGHPDQNVRTITMGLRRETGSASVELALDIVFRGGETTRGRVKAGCRSAESAYLLSCTAHCDGGRLALVDRGNAAVRLEIPAGLMLERGGSCDAGSLGGNGALWSDDRVFRLDRAALSSCGLEAAPAVHLPGDAPPVADPAADGR